MTVTLAEEVLDDWRDAAALDGRANVAPVVGDGFVAFERCGAGRGRRLEVGKGKVEFVRATCPEPFEAFGVPDDWAGTATVPAPALFDGDRVVVPTGIVRGRLGRRNAPKEAPEPF